MYVDVASMPEAGGSDRLGLRNSNRAFDLSNEFHETRFVARSKERTSGRFFRQCLVQLIWSLACTTGSALSLRDFLASNTSAGPESNSTTTSLAPSNNAGSIQQWQLFATLAAGAVNVTFGLGVPALLLVFDSSDFSS